MISRLQRYYQDIRARFIGRCEMNERNEQAFMKDGDIFGAAVACGRKRLYQTVLDDIFYLMPKFELPWKAAARRYRTGMRMFKAERARLERELQNAYERIDELQKGTAY